MEIEKEKETFKEWFNKNVCTSYDATMGTFNKVWFKRLWDYKEKQLDQKEARIKKLERMNRRYSEKFNKFLNIEENYQVMIKKLEQQNDTLDSKVKYNKQECHKLFYKLRELEEENKELKEILLEVLENTYRNKKLYEWYCENKKEIKS